MGVDARDPLPENIWIRVFDIFNVKIEAEMLQGTWPQGFHLLGTKWYENRGIMFCSNKITVEACTNMISNIKINDMTFRAWQENEYANLVTLILPERTKMFKSNIWRLFLASNRLEGKYSEPRTTDLKDGWRRLTCGVSDELAAMIRQLGGRAPLCGLSITAHCSK